MILTAKFRWRSLIVTSLLACATSAVQAAVNISSQPTRNMSCSAGVCSPTAKKAVLNTADLETMLQASDVKVTTGNGAITIEVTSGLTWASNSRLTLEADCNVSIKAPVAVAGSGALSVVYNGGHTGNCDFLIFPGGKVDFWDLSSDLDINGASYLLVSDVASLSLAITNNPSGRYALAQDYDASVDGTYQRSPIEYDVKGIVEGLGHTVENVTIDVPSGDRETQYGFFRSIQSPGILRDFRLERLKLQTHCQGDEIGGLVAQNQGTIAYDSVDGTIAGGSQDGSIGGLNGTNQWVVTNSLSSGFVQPCKGIVEAGGLVGTNDASFSTIAGSSSDAHVQGSRIGGLVGVNRGTIRGSHTSGWVEAGNGNAQRGAQLAGGLVNDNSGTIDACYATGLVTAGSGSIVGANQYLVYAGGLVAQNGGAITRSFSTGAVQTRDFSIAGGLAGEATINSPTGGPIENSYSASAVTAGATGSRVGGFVGEGDDGLGISASYSTGNLSLSAKALRGTTDAHYVGGFLGFDGANPRTVANAYWDLDTSGVSDPSAGAGNIANDPGITGLGDRRLRSRLPDGFDPAIWAQSKSINNGYPYLLANPPPK